MSSEAKPAHHITVELGDGGAYAVLHCPFEAADTERPCWPSTENPVGPAEDDDEWEEWISCSPEEGARFGCTWKEAWDDLGFEMVDKPFTIDVPVKRFFWNGDGYEVELGEIQK
jgi:hypothetical protein